MCSLFAACHSYCIMSYAIADVEQIVALVRSSCIMYDACIFFEVSVCIMKDVIAEVEQLCMHNGGCMS